MSNKRRPTSGVKRKRKKWLMNKVVEPVVFSVGCAALVLFLPVVLPCLAIAEWFETRRKRAVVARFTCTRCGAALGEISLQLADAAWGEHCQKLHDDHPGVKFRLPPRTLDAVCSNCGQRFTYRDKEKTFVEEAEDGGQVVSKGAL